MRIIKKEYQEYERAVMFRLGLLLSGGARGPGVFFIIPCVDIVEIVDMRVQVFNVPPQEVRLLQARKQEKVTEHSLLLRS